MTFPGRTLSLLLTLLWATAARSLPAQLADRPGIGLNWAVSSGLIQNTGAETLPAWSHAITVPAATSLEIAFDEVVFDSDQDHIIVLDPASGEIQRLDRLRLEQWSNHSAWFNASSVLIELRLSPGSSGTATVGHVLAGFDIGGPDSLCDQDNRVPATSNSLCRFVSSSAATAGVSTGFIMNDGVGITPGNIVVCGAGSSVGVSIVIAEFNVPASTGSGTIVHPPVADQYPVDQTSITSANTGTGNNWAVMRLHPNSIGQTVEGRQGGGLDMAPSLPGLFAQLQINSFGDDTEPTRNFIQQLDRGPYTFQLGNTISYWVDTTNGSQGAPVMIDSTNEVIGIHNSGGCNPALGQSNNGTSILNSSLQTAIQATATCLETLALSGTSVTSSPLACTPRALAITPSNLSWNLIAARAGFVFSDDIALEINGDTSDQDQGLCEFLIANGNLNPNLAPTTAYVHKQGSPNAERAQFQTATSFSVGNTINLDWDLTTSNVGLGVAPTLARIVEFEVTAAGDYDITVNGPDGLRWRLHGPGSSTLWRPRSEAAISNGIVGRDTVDDIALSTGWHAIVIFEDLVNGVHPFPNLTQYYPPEVSVTVHPAATNLHPDPNSTATTITSVTDYQDFDVDPVGSVWNAVALTNVPGPTLTPSWNLYLGSAQSRLGVSLADWAIANGHLGNIPADEGVVTRSAIPGSCLFQHVSEIGLGLEQMAAGRQVAVHDLGTVAGSIDVAVIGGAGDTLRWYLVSARNAQWI